MIILLHIAGLHSQKLKCPLHFLVLSQLQLSLLTDRIQLHCFVYNFHSFLHIHICEIAWIRSRWCCLVLWDWLNFSIFSSGFTFKFTLLLFSPHLSQLIWLLIFFCHFIELIGYLLIFNGRKIKSGRNFHLWPMIIYLDYFWKQGLL